jgi:hypothetical protein
MAVGLLGFQADTRGLDAFDKEAAAFLEGARKNLETILANKAFEILEVGPVHQQRAVTSAGTLEMPCCMEPAT